MMDADEEKVSKQQMGIKEEDEDEISVPNWLIDVLKWIPKIEMANSSLSFSSKIFYRLCWPKLQGNVEPHIVPYLEFCYQPDKFGNLNGILKGKGRYPAIPIEANPPPDYILGFKNIEISFIDNWVIQFMENIKHREIKLTFNSYIQEWVESDDQVLLISRLLEILAKNIYELKLYNFESGKHFHQFDCFFHNFIDQVPHVNISNPVDLDFEIIFNWLHKQRMDGTPKMFSYLFLRNNEPQRERELCFVNRIKEKFLYSNEPAFFLVFLQFEYAQFNLQNQQTGEVLNLFHQLNPWGQLCVFLARYPKGEEQWKEKLFEKFFSLTYSTTILLQIKELKEMKENKADVTDCSPALSISDDGLTVTHSACSNSSGDNFVCTEMSVEFFTDSMLEKYIACYFEVTILNQWDVGIGFSDVEFPFKEESEQRNISIGARINSIGFLCKEGRALIEGRRGSCILFEESSRRQGNVVGCGLLHSAPKNWLKFFVTYNGTLLDIITVSMKFIYLELFPTITMGSSAVSICANFGKEEFSFDRSKLFE